MVAFMENIFHAIFGVFVSTKPALVIMSVSFIISLLIQLSYKFLTDQDKMHELKSRQKELQHSLKDPNSSKEKQQEAMQVNMEFMKMSFKPTMYTMLPILLIVTTLGSMFAYAPLDNYFSIEVPSEEVQIYGENIVELDRDISSEKTVLELRSDKNGLNDLEIQTLDNNYQLNIDVGGTSHTVPAGVNLIQPSLKPWGEFSLFGWQPGWLGVYIITSLVSSLIFRRVFNLA